MTTHKIFLFHFSLIVSIEPDDLLQSTIDQISKLLQIDRSENEKTIIEDLLQHGQRSLRMYRDCQIPDIYINMTNDDDNELIKKLTIYYHERWKRQYHSSNPWFALFLDTIQSTDYRNMYEKVLLRTAKYGNRFMKNCSMLSIILQILFEGITDQCLEESNLLNQLWFTITMNGIQSTTQYSRYIITDIMDEQINHNDSILFRSLREYYRQELTPFFQQLNIEDRRNLYQSAFDNLTRLGWKDGLSTLQNKLLPDIYQILLKNIDEYLQKQQKTFERKGNLIFEIA